VQVTVGELAHGGAAVARIDGRVVFVEGAIPGETVEADITHRRKDFWRAQATAVLEPAATRVEPPCPYFKAGCGGCQLQYLAYPEQLSQKRLVLHRQLVRAHVEFPIERIDVLGMDDPWRYRIRGEFHVLHRAGAVSLGFYRKHTYQTLPIDTCLIHAEAIERALPAFARAAEDPAAARVTALQFTWAPGTSDLLWSPYPPGAADPGFGARAAGWIPELNLNDDSIGIDDAGRHFRVRPEAFVQVNARQRDVLYQRAVTFAQLGGGDRVVDAYAGIGMLTARLAEHASEVIAVEESPYAVRLGELNMQLNGCSNVKFRRGRVEDTLSQIEGAIDVLVLDPPRAGCAETAVEAMANLRAERIVYISCDPSTLARDVNRFCAAGRYTLVEVAFVDMFPQTFHIEAVVKLERNA
jgi:23S rRNA (uracil1939-C5)-methyltransferase